MSTETPLTLKTKDTRLFGLGTGLIGSQLEIIQTEKTMEILQGKAFHSPSKEKEKVEVKKETLPPSEEAKMMADVAKLNSMSIRYNKFKAILETPNVDLGRFVSFRATQKVELVRDSGRN